MKIKSLILISLIVTSCETPKNSNSTDIKDKTADSDIVKIDTFISRFKISHSNINKNDVYNSDAQTDFEMACKKYLIDSGLLTTIPLKIVSIKPPLIGDASNKFIIHLKYEPATQSFTGDVYKNLKIDIFIDASKKVAGELDQNDNLRYKIINPKNIKLLDRGTLMGLSNDMVETYNPHIQIENIEKYISGNEYDLGCYEMSTDSISLVK